jgi:hypothetical protein
LRSAGSGVEANQWRSLFMTDFEGNPATWVDDQGRLRDLDGNLVPTGPESKPGDKNWEPPADLSYADKANLVDAAAGTGIWYGIDAIATAAAQAAKAAGDVKKAWDIYQAAKTAVKTGKSVKDAISGLIPPTGSQGDALAASMQDDPNQSDPTDPVIGTPYEPPPEIGTPYEAPPETGSPIPPPPQDIEPTDPVITPENPTPVQPPMHPPGVPHHPPSAPPSSVQPPASPPTTNPEIPNPSYAPADPTQSETTAVPTPPTDPTGNIAESATTPSVPAQDIDGTEIPSIGGAIERLPQEETSFEGEGVGKKRKSEETSFEFHAPLFVRGKFKKARFAGPGTHIIERLDQDPLTDSDRAAKIHDIEYALAKNYKDVSKADKDYLARIWKSDDNLFNQTVSSLPIALKHGLNELVPASRGMFTSINQGGERMTNQQEVAYRQQLAKEKLNVYDPLGELGKTRAFEKKTKVLRDTALVATGGLPLLAARKYYQHRYRNFN